MEMAGGGGADGGITCVSLVILLVVVVLVLVVVVVVVVVVFDAIFQAECSMSTNAEDTLCRSPRWQRTLRRRGLRKLALIVSAN